MPISGLFEIHITVDERDTYPFRKWCMAHKMKPILAVSYNNHQLMLSKYLNASSENEAIDRAKRLRQELIDARIAVLRVKVESMGSNPGVPLKPTDGGHNAYFEFHLKMPVETAIEFNALEDLIRGTTKWQTFMSFNAYKRETVPLVTLRVPGQVGSEEAIRIKDDWMAWLKTGGFHSNEGIQFEFAVYDTNLSLDRF